MDYECDETQCHFIAIDSTQTPPKVMITQRILTLTYNIMTQESTFTSGAGTLPNTAIQDFIHQS